MWVTDTVDNRPVSKLGKSYKGNDEWYEDGCVSYRRTYVTVKEFFFRCRTSHIGLSNLYDQLIDQLVLEVINVCIFTTYFLIPFGVAVKQRIFTLCWL